MNRRLALKIAHVVVAMTLAMHVVHAQPVVTPINGNANAPVLIVVVGDHYTATEQTEFNYAVDNFFKYGLLLDKYYKTQLPNLRILSYFNAPSTGPSSYGFTLTPSAGNCAVTAGPGTTGMLNATLSAAGNVPSRVHFVVLGNYQYDFGCTGPGGEWTYVAVDAVGTDVLQHEFGHELGALFDEWALASNGNTPYPHFIPPGDIRNCAPAGVTPPWVTNHPAPPQPAYDNAPECDLYKVGVQHPRHMCRMGAMHYREFCNVCAKAMDSVFLDLIDPGRMDRLNLQVSHEPTPRPRFGVVNAAFAIAPSLVQPTPGAPVARRMARVVIAFNPGLEKPAGSLRGSSFITGTYVPSYRRYGEYLYEIIENNETKDIGILNDQLMRARGYRGSGGLHATGAPSGPLEVVISVPVQDEKSFANGGSRLVMYKIPTAITDATINLERFKVIKSRLVELFTIQLK
jgi:hypothetical protein